MLADIFNVVVFLLVVASFLQFVVVLQIAASEMFDFKELLGIQRIVKDVPLVVEQTFAVGVAIACLEHGRGHEHHLVAVVGLAHLVVSVLDIEDAVLVLRLVVVVLLDLLAVLRVFLLDAQQAQFVLVSLLLVLTVVGVAVDGRVGPIHFLAVDWLTVLSCLSVRRALHGLVCRLPVDLQVD